MKVFLFSTQWPEYMIELANALSEQCTVILMLPENHRFTARHKELIDRRVNFESFVVVFHKSFKDNFKMLFDILNKIWKHRPDILHIQANGHRLFYWVLLLKPIKTKVINTIHDPVKHKGDALSGAIDDTLSRAVAKIFTKKYVVHAEILREELKVAYKLRSQKISVIPHGNFGIYKKFQTEQVSEEVNTVLFFGRIWEYKGLEYFIEAANQVIPRNPSINFCIVGAGEDMAKYRKRILFPEKFKVVNKRVSLGEAGYFFQKCSLVVLPYIEATQSGVIPVAYAYGKPVIATRVGGLPEVVMDGITGFLVDPRSAEQLADRILHVLGDSDLKNQMGSAAYNFAFNVLSWKRVANLSREVYLSVL